jgi:hypothetical protein
MKVLLQKGILFIALTVCNGLAYAQTPVQQYEQTLQLAYENALLDSLISFELLKPIHHTLSQTNVLLNQQALAFKAENDNLQMQLSAMRDHYEAMLKAERKKRRKQVAVAFLFGLGTGKLTPPY